MASVRKLVSGHYQVRFRDAGGRERSKTFTKKVHADKYRSQVEYELDRGDWLDPRAGEVRLVDWFEEAWDLATPVKRRTASDRRSNMNKHVLPTFGDRPLNRIDPEDVQRWVNGLSAAGYAPATVKKIFETLSGVLRTAVRYGRLTHLVCDKISLPAIPQVEMRFLVPEEVDRLASAITPHFELLIRFAAETGLRIGEIAGLQGNDYQPGEHVIAVKRQLLKDTSPPTYADPKTAAGIRSLTLSPALAERVDAINAVGDAPMFTSPQGALLNVANFRKRHFLPAVAAAGLGHVRIHDLRHSAISLWIHRGATIKQVTTRAGIASVTTAFDRYGHIFPNEDRNLATRLNQPTTGR